MSINKHKKSITIGFVIFVIILLIVGFSYASFVYTAPTTTGQMQTISDTFCIENGINKLSDCIKTQNANNVQVQSAEQIIQARTYATTELSPIVSNIYQKKIRSHIQMPSSYGVYYTSLDDEISYSNSEPVFNSSTGKYAFVYSGKKSVQEILDDTSSGHIRYLCNTTSQSNVNCDYIYVLNEVTYDSNSLKYNLSDVDLFTSITTISSNNSGLFAAEDYNNTTSYFFRGMVQNNYVKFAGKYYKIIRINGDGSIRIIYIGDSPTGVVDSSLRKKQFNSTKTFPYNSFYMYDDTKTRLNFSNSLKIYSQTEYYFDNYNSATGSYNDDPCVLNNDNTVSCTLKGRYVQGTYRNNYNQLKTGFDGDGSHPYKYVCLGGTFDSNTETVTCSDYYNLIDFNNSANTAGVKNVIVDYYGYFVSENTQRSNNKSSYVKSVIDSWYQTNVANQNSLYGNSYDTYVADSVFCADRSISSSSPYQGLTEYLYDLNIYYNFYDKSYGQNLSYMCTDVRDRFTVNQTDQNRNVEGNGSLTYKVGLISANETVYAGNIYQAQNEYNYLYTGRIYWTLTPSEFKNTVLSSGVFAIAANGRLTATASDTQSDIRPVINLDKDVYITGGNGTVRNPYEIISKAEYDALQNN